MNHLDGSVTAQECCKGLAALTPVNLTNRPGLPALAYRVGTHASFKATMLARLSTVPALRALATRRDDDPTVALLDAWATVADVLTFYQERIANEGYLRTATELRSILELARAIGYELRPGVAASVYLAFTLDDSPGSPRKVTIPADTRVQSLPAKEELPQTFETSEEVVARPEWNAMKPRMTHPQYFDKGTRTFYFKGTATNLKLSDWMLLLARDSSDPKATGDIQKVSLQVVRVEPDSVNQRTKVDLDESPPPVREYVRAVGKIGEFTLIPQPLTTSSVSSIVTEASWRDGDLLGYASIQRWSLNDLVRHVQAARRLPRPPTDIGVFAMRVKTAPFGHNALKWETLPASQRFGEFVVKQDGTSEYKPGPYINDWETKDITTNSQGTSYGEGVVYLESTFPEIQDDSWVVIKSSTVKSSVYSVKATSEKSLADFGLSAKVTGLTLDTSDHLTDYKVRETTIYAGSEKLELADLPIEDDIAGGSIELDTMQVGLEAGQTVILTGERSDLEGVVESEVVVLADVVHAGGYTELVFVRPLEHPYKRSSVTINANVARATHGETKHEVLGNGDAGQGMQRFTLRQKPLTYVSAPVPSGARSTLEVRVNGVLWHEAPGLWQLGPSDRAYVVRRDDEGKATVQFGDGTHGARPPTGAENVTARFRVGIGLAGLVSASQISLLQTRPLGVRSVSNPLPSTGAAEPETLSEARQNAPLTVLTLDRIVSLKDFEDFTRAFSGIGKASATWLWDGETRIVHVTIADANGDPVPPDSAPYGNLLAAMNRARDPLQRVRLDSYQPLLFNLDAAVMVHPDYEPEKVLKEVEARLRAAFSFTARAFGQNVALSEVMAVIQEVPGVEAVDVNYFYYSHESATPTLQPWLSATPARLRPDGTVQPAQLLTITPAPINLTVMR